MGKRVRLDRARPRGLADRGAPRARRAVRRMLEERGYDLQDPVVLEDEERDVVSEYLAAREVADQVNLAGEVDPGDVAAAINGLRAIYDFVIAELEPP